MQKKAIRVLVVDDEAIERMYLGLILPKLGAECIGEADTAEDAVRLTGELSPDIVFMDIKLRGKKDGMWATTEIGRGSCVPVVLMSAYNPELIGWPNPGISNVIQFLSKPITSEMLEDVLSTIGGS